MKLSDNELDSSKYNSYIEFPIGELANHIKTILGQRQLKFTQSHATHRIRVDWDTLHSITKDLPIAFVRMINDYIDGLCLFEEDADWSEEDNKEEEESYSDEELGLKTNTEILGRDENETLFMGSILPISEEPEVGEIGDINAKAGTVLGTGTIIEKTELQDNPESVNKIIQPGAGLYKQILSGTAVSSQTINVNKKSNSPAPTQENPRPIKKVDVSVAKQEPSTQLDDADMKMLKLMQS